MQRQVSVPHPLSIHPPRRTALIVLTMLLTWGLAGEGWASVCCCDDKFKNCTEDLNADPTYACPYDKPNNVNPEQYCRPETSSSTGKVCCGIRGLSFSENESRIASYERKDSCGLNDEPVDDSFCQSPTYSSNDEVEGKNKKTDDPSPSDKLTDGKDSSGKSRDPAASDKPGKEIPKVKVINEDVVKCTAQLDGYKISFDGEKFSTKQQGEKVSKKTTIQYEYRGSEAFQKCQTMTKEKWGDLVFKNASDIENSFYNQGWKEAKEEAMRLIGEKIKAVEEASEKCVGDSTPKNQENLRTALRTLANQITASQGELQTLAIELDKCIGTVPAMDYVKYNDNNLITGNAKNMGVLEAKTSDGKIECSTTGVEVQDYPACKDIVNAYDGAIVGETVMGVVQTYQTNLNVNENLYDYNKDPTNPKAALSAQLNSTKNERVISDTRTGFYTAKMAAMAGLITAIPNYDDLLKKCEDKFGTSHQTKISVEANLKGGNPDKSFVATLEKELQNIVKVGQFNLTSGEEVYNKYGNERDAGFCGNAIYQTEFNLIQNQRAKDAAIEAAMQAGVDMTKYGLSSVLLRDQEKRIKNAMKDIDDYAPKDYEVKLKDEKVKYCQKYPNADGCRYTAHNPYESSLADNTITLQGSGANETGLDVDNEDGSYGADNIASGSQAVNPFGDAVIAASESSDYESPPPAPGSLKPITDGGGKGGEGGGGGGSSNVPSGDNNKGSSNPAGGNYKPQVVNYSAGGATVGYSGGRVRQTTEKTKNPLEGLLNKAGPEDNNNTISTFRNPASGLGVSTDDLFQKLSKRYSVVVGQKRLIEYDIIDKNTKKLKKPSPRP